jgi:hypothetical protein
MHQGESLNKDDCNSLIEDIIDNRSDWNDCVDDEGSACRDDPQIDWNLAAKTMADCVVLQLKSWILQSYIIANAG